WNLNAGVMEEAQADIILGTNFMFENNAIIDLKNQQIALRNEKTEQLVVLPLTLNQLVHSISIPYQVNVAIPMEICLKGPKEYQCIRGYPPKANVLPCAKCKDRLEEAEDYEREWYNWSLYR